jgi:hypothetical protein
VRLSPASLTSVAGYALQAGLGVLAFALTRIGGDLGALGRSGNATLLGIAAVFLVGSIAGLTGARRAAGTDLHSQFRLPLAMTLLTGIICWLAIEIALRVVARPDPLGARIGNVVLLPYDWPTVVAANRAMLERARGPDAFYVSDPELGWRIAPSRRSRDGLYMSSAEGLRSGSIGARHADTPADKRVALFGNSYAFSEEVAYPESLAPQLEAELPTGTSVLNFGVPGYGVDQAVLRARLLDPAWQPRVALLTFINDDLYRVGNVYAFLKVSWGLPVSKPRFVVDAGGQLELRNFPPLAGDELFGRESIFDLPLLDLDNEFVAERWRRHPLHASWLLRLLDGLYPPWPRPGPLADDPAIADVSARVIEDFAKRSLASGIRPVIAYLPTSGDFRSDSSRVVRDTVLRQLASAGVPAANLTDCIRAGGLAQDALFMPGGHYTGAGNALLARCLAPLVRAGT